MATLLFSGVRAQSEAHARDLGSSKNVLLVYGKTKTR